MADNIVYCGALLKYKSFLKWSSKNFTLTSEALSYSLASRNEGFFHLNSIEVQNGSGVCFNIINEKTKENLLYLKAPSLEEKTGWINAINRQKSNVVFCGCLRKWTNIIKGWQPRYFILYKDRLCYYLNGDKIGVRRGTIYLVGRNICLTHSTSTYGFDVVSPHTHTTWYLRGTSGEERAGWIGKIVGVSNSSSNQTDCCDKTMSPTFSRTSSVASLPPSAPPLPPSAPPPPSITNQDSDQEANYRKDVECTICLDLLYEPTSLNCGHTFCRNCLADLWASNRSNFQCPTCRSTIVTVPAVNIVLQNVISVLYDTEVVKERLPSTNREVFDSLYLTSQSNTGRQQSTNRQTNIPTNLEYEFVKRGMFLIFILWVGSKILSPFFYQNHDYNESQQHSSKGESESNETIKSTPFDSRNSAIFLILGSGSPRALSIYLIIFWYNSLFHPALSTIGAALKQGLGLALHLKLFIWNIPLPLIWLIPYTIENGSNFQAAGILVISMLDLWDLFFITREVIYIRHDRHVYLTTLLKREVGGAMIRIVICRAVSYLPWNWLPNFLYEGVLLMITGDLIISLVKRGRGLLDRTRALNSSIPPAGVTIQNVEVSTGREL